MIGAGGSCAPTPKFRPPATLKTQDENCNNFIDSPPTHHYYHVLFYLPNTEILFPTLPLKQTSHPLFPSHSANPEVLSGAVQFVYLCIGVITAEGST